MIKQLRWAPRLLRSFRALARIEDPRSDAVRSAVARLMLPVGLTARERHAQRALRELRRSYPTTGEVVVEGRRVAVSDFARASSSSSAWTRFLHQLAWVHQPRHTLELGSATGVSAVAMALSLRQGDAQLYTVDARTADLARSSVRSAGVGDRVTVSSGWFDDVLPTLLPRAAPLDLVFVDGNHAEEATIRYVEMVRPFLSSRAIVLLDDIRWTLGMQRAWRRLEDHEGLSFTVDLGRMGILAFSDDRAPSVPM